MLPYVTYIINHRRNYLITMPLIKSHKNYIIQLLNNKHIQKLCSIFCLSVTKPCIHFGNLSIILETIKKFRKI